MVVLVILAKPEVSRECFGRRDLLSENYRSRAVDEIARNMNLCENEMGGIYSNNLYNCPDLIMFAGD